MIMAPMALMKTENMISPSEYREYCLASITFFSAIAALPQSDAGIVMRKVLADR